MPQQQSKPAMIARGEREPARRGQVGTVIRQFGDDACDRAAFERLLHRKQRVDGAPRPQHQETLRRQAEQIEAGAIERAAFVSCEIGLDPERLAAAFGGKAGQRQREAAGRAEIARPLRRHFMQGAEGRARRPAWNRVPRPPKPAAASPYRIENAGYSLSSRADDRAYPERFGAGHEAIHVLYLFLLIPGFGLGVKRASAASLAAPCAEGLGTALAGTSINSRNGASSSYSKPPVS